MSQNIDDNKFSNLILKEVGSYNTVKIAEYVMTTDFANNNAKVYFLNNSIYECWL